MRITLIDAGKRFNRDWIFRHLSYTFTSGNSYAITGPNGSGKSTLLQSIAGAIGISEGGIQYADDPKSHDPKSHNPNGQDAPEANPPHRSGAAKNNGDIPPDLAYKYLSLAAPYLELVEEMTALEFLHFHGSFKSFLPGLGEMEIIRQVGLGEAAQKQVRYYSSGMKQRLKLAQAIFSDTDILLLDEPCTNLDVDGIDLYRNLIDRFTRDRLVIVSSNDRQEYDFCRETINIMDHK